MLKLKQSGLFWLWISVFIFVLDQLTKYLVIKQLTPYHSVKVTAFFNLTLTFNSGAAFSFLNHNNSHGSWPWQTWFLTGLSLVVSIAIIVWLMKISRKALWNCFALNFILGGAVGNLWDRICIGKVVDFLHFHLNHWSYPVFNLADSAIFVGALMIAISFFKTKPSSSQT